MAGHVYVLEVAFRDGRRAHVAQVRQGPPGWEDLLDEAVEYFEERHAGEGIVTVHYGRDPYTLGVSDPERVPEWKGRPT